MMVDATSDHAPEMTPERWRQVQWLFDAVLEKTPEERPAYLEQVTVADPALRREVASLIRSLESASRFLDGPASSEAALGSKSSTRDRAEPFIPGMRVGAYRLQRLLGSGGAGQVFLAVRDDAAYEKEVAVKVIKRGMDTDELVRRFVSERQILAQLEHLNIAKLLDGGAADDGRPFLVMEYVDGLPIDRWCREQGLGLRARLDLFLAVCDAVHFAHTNLVVHRDLKPGNILVAADGTPKLLDFGIAKLLDPTAFPRTVLPTAPGWRAMTPQYASPEQVRGSVVTTASDVYSLGVVLYELLTGRRPYTIDDLSPTAIERVVCQQEPPRASRRVREMVQREGKSTAAEGGVVDPRELEHRLRGDLDAILFRALEKEPERRYPSVEQLAADLRRHLEGRPVLARKDTFFYRSSKFIRRNRWPVAVVGAIFGLLVIFLLTLWQQQGQIIQQRDRAEMVSEFLVDLFGVADPSRERGETITARELLDRGARDAEARLRDQPGVLGDLLGTMGTTYTSLGLFPEAEALLERSLDLRLEAHGERDPSVAAAWQQLSNLALAIDDLERAEELGRRALASRQRFFGDHRPEVVESRFRLALVRDRQGDEDEAGRLLAQAEIEARRLGLDDLLISILLRRGQLARSLDDRLSARRWLDEALVVAERVWGEVHPQVALILNQLGELERNHDPKRTGELLERALAIQRQVFKGPHPDTAQVLNNLGVLDEQLGRHEAAEARYRESLAMQLEIAPESNLLAAAVCNNLARLLAREGRLEEAETLYRKALDENLRVLGPHHEETANVLNNLGALAQRSGHFDEAGEHYLRALEILLETVGEGHSRLGPVYNNLGQVAKERGDYEGAIAFYEKGIAVLRSISPTHVELPRILQNLAAVEALGEKTTRAASLYREALEILAATGDVMGHDAALIHTNLAVAKLRAGEPGAAEPPARDAVAIYEALGERGGIDWLRARRLLAIAFELQGRLAEAETVARENLAVCREQQGSEAAECVRHRLTLDKILDEIGDESGGTIGDKVTASTDG